MVVRSWSNNSARQAADKLNAKFVGIRTQVEVLVRRRVDDLSF